MSQIIHIFKISKISHISQVFVRHQPELKGKPVAVLQYSDALDGGSSAIAVSYEARALGVKRGMPKKEILKINPEIELVVMPNNRKKADLSMFRSASCEVMAILSKHATVFERASIDEAYIDITDNVKRMIGLPISKEKLSRTYIAGYEGGREEQIEAWSDHLAGVSHHSQDYKLTLGAVYVNMIRSQVLSDTQFTCSAGIGFNKIVAKLAAGTHKPNAQTIITLDNIPALYQTINFTKIRNFGGKLGKAMQEELQIEWASELLKFSQADLISRYGDKTGQWIYNIARGMDFEPVKHRSLVKQSACSKNFPQGIKLVSELEKWVKDLSDELEERLSFELSDNKRIPTQFSTHMRLKQGGSTSVQMPLLKCDVEHITASAVKCINKKLTPHEGRYSDVVYMLSITAGKFVPAPEKNNIFSMLKSREREKYSENTTKNESCDVNESTSDHAKPSKEKLSGFFEKLKNDTPGPSKSPIHGLLDKDQEETVKEPVSAVPVTNLKKENSMNPWNSLSDNDQKIMLQAVDGVKSRCPVCSKSVLESKMSEHLDFHTALTLQRKIEAELKQQDASDSPKRKLPQTKRTNKKQKVSNIPTKNISSFFKKV